MQGALHLVKGRPEVPEKLEPLARALLCPRVENSGVEVRTGMEMIRFESDKRDRPLSSCDLIRTGRGAGVRLPCRHG